MKKYPRFLISRELVLKSSMPKQYLIDKAKTYTDYQIKILVWDLADCEAWATLRLLFDALQYDASLTVKQCLAMHQLLEK